MMTQALEYRTELLAVARRYTRNHHDAEDLVQETIVKAIIAGGAPDNLRAWLHKVMKNTFLSGVRDRRATVDVDCVQLPAPPPAPAEEVSDLVLRAIAELPEELQQVLRAEAEGCDPHEVKLNGRGDVEYRTTKGYGEIAAQLGLPVSKVTARLYRARKRLREMLADYARAEYGLGLR